VTFLKERDKFGGDPVALEYHGFIPFEKYSLR